jgi:hypothetical protein
VHSRPDPDAYAWRRVATSKPERPSAIPLQDEPNNKEITAQNQTFIFLQKI